MLARIGDEVMERWPKVAAVSILHRTGRLEVGEASVIIAVSTPHRGDGSFEACRYAIERLKAVVPIWKQENWSDGQVWVEGPRQPELAAQWQKEEEGKRVAGDVSPVTSLFRLVRRQATAGTRRCAAQCSRQ